jgi:osmoprotectant transport system permease protein
VSNRHRFIPTSTRAIGVLLLLASGGYFSPCAAQQVEQSTVTIGSKSFTESVVLAELLAAVGRSEAHRFDSLHRAGLGGTQIVFEALRKGEIDVYPEYTGTLSQVVFAGQGLRTDDELRAALAEQGIVMSQRIGFNNTYGLGMKESTAQALGISKISDLESHAEAIQAGMLKFGFSEEFLYRNDGWPGVLGKYRLEKVDAGGARSQPGLSRAWTRASCR